MTINVFLPMFIVISISVLPSFLPFFKSQRPKPHDPHPAQNGPSTFDVGMLASASIRKYACTHLYACVCRVCVCVWARTGESVCCMRRACLCRGSREGCKQSSVMSETQTRGALCARGAPRRAQKMQEDPLLALPSPRAGRATHGLGPKLLRM